MQGTDASVHSLDGYTCQGTSSLMDGPQIKQSIPSGATSSCMEAPASAVELSSCRAVELSSCRVDSLTALTAKARCIAVELSRSCRLDSLTAAVEAVELSRICRELSRIAVELSSRGSGFRIDLRLGWYTPWVYHTTI